MAVHLSTLSKISAGYLFCGAFGFAIVLQSILGHEEPWMMWNGLLLLMFSLLMLLTVRSYRNDYLKGKHLR